jgi:hypothetical protein
MRTVILDCDIASCLAKINRMESVSFELLRASQTGFSFPDLIFKSIPVISLNQDERIMLQDIPKNNDLPWSAIPRPSSHLWPCPGNPLAWEIVDHGALQKLIILRYENRTQCIPRRSFMALISDCTCLRVIPYPGWISSLMPLISSRVFFVLSLISRRTGIALFNWIAEQI